jgi:hypothetical protein
MEVISKMLRELLALFVDDGAFALAILAWLAGGWACIELLKFPPSNEAILLFIGLSYLLADSVLRAARRK